MMRVFRLVRGALLAAAAVSLLAGRVVHAEILVHFDQDVYYVNGPGEKIDVMILLDADAATDGDDALPEGLFSFGVAATFDPSKAQVGSESDVSAAAELDFFGFANGAFESVSAGLAGVKGNIDQSANPLVPYGAPLLAQIQLTNLASAPDSYPLLLDFFETLGPNEQLFIDGAGTVLDDQIQFRSARVIVVPEPSSSGLLLVAMLALGCCSLCVARPRRAVVLERQYKHDAQASVPRAMVSRAMVPGISLRRCSVADASCLYVGLPRSLASASCLYVTQIPHSLARRACMLGSLAHSLARRACVLGSLAHSLARRACIASQLLLRAICVNRSSVFLLNNEHLPEPQETRACPYRQPIAKDGNG